MSAITAVRTARKGHTCGRCRGTISPGCRYREWKIPPSDEWTDFGNTGWSLERVHLTYAECLSRPCEFVCPLALDGGSGAAPCFVCLAPEPGVRP